MQIDGKRIVITGAASGIGQAVLEQISVYRAQILAVDVDAVRLQKSVDKQVDKAANIEAYACDLSQVTAVDPMFEDACRMMGGIDLFIANAGFAYYERIQQSDWSRIARIYQVNVFASLYAVEKMAQLNGDRAYKVVITASAMGLLAIPGYALYSSTKGALHRFAEAYRYELDDPRKLALVYPIGTRTQFFDAAARQGAPQPWPTQTPEQVARAIIRGIQKDQQSIYPSRLFRLVILLDRFLPFMRRIEQAIEARRFQQWLAKNGSG